jgi:UDP-glucose 4-epimerase
VVAYLVTGGCGFIGSHLVDALCARGHQVRILDNLSSGTLAHKPTQAEFVRGDVADAAAVREAMRGVAGCFHLAAVASVEKSSADWFGAHRTNAGGSVAVFEAARATGGTASIPVVFASSAAVYGDNPDVPLSEEAAPRPLSAYAADKLGSELHGGVAARIHGLPNRGLRFFNVYGPRQDPGSPYSGVISIFCDRLRAGRALTLYGDGHQTRDFVYVGDVVAALLAAMDDCAAAREARADVLNVCTGKATSIRDLAGILGRIVGAEPEIALAPPRRGDVRFSVGDPAKARRMLGFSAATELDAGLRRTLQEAAPA